ncbi:hypothetical protein CC78DRAFT_576161 [Lojkania enalia]|uniref:Uncharacterized protein n=1 Tax=Lojkania enalia TaxID=147567 RepID=A0A9P4KI00_9PLEO|nr:hypothetical protein CC78DRAFT_576161 [Didymosphaeria enalia]
MPLQHSITHPTNRTPRDVNPWKHQKHQQHQKQHPNTRPNRPPTLPPPFCITSPPPITPHTTIIPPTRNPILSTLHRKAPTPTKDATRRLGYVLQSSHNLNPTPHLLHLSTTTHHKYNYVLTGSVSFPLPLIYTFTLGIYNSLAISLTLPTSTWKLHITPKSRHISKSSSS